MLRLSSLNRNHIQTFDASCGYRLRGASWCRLYLEHQVFLLKQRVAVAKGRWQPRHATAARCDSDQGVLARSPPRYPSYRESVGFQ